MRLENKTKPLLRALAASQRLLISDGGYLTHKLMNWAPHSITCSFPVTLTLFQWTQWITVTQYFDSLNKVKKKQPDQCKCV